MEPNRWKTSPRPRLFSMGKFWADIVGQLVEFGAILAELFDCKLCNLCWEHTEEKKHHFLGASNKIREERDGRNWRQWIKPLGEPASQANSARLDCMFVCLGPAESQHTGRLYGAGINNRLKANINRSNFLMRALISLAKISRIHCKVSSYSGARVSPRMERRKQGPHSLLTNQ